MVNAVLTYFKVKIMKNVLLVIMAALFIVCGGGVCGAIAALMMGNGPVMVIAIITAMASAPALFVVVPLFDALDE